MPTIRPTASTEVVVGASMRGTAESPTVGGATPRTATAAAAFVFLDLFTCALEPLIP